MLEAWNWLERQGLLIHNDQQVGDWFVISSDGEKFLGRNARFERLESLGLDRVKHDLQNGGFRVVGGTAENQEEAWEWVRMKENKPPLKPLVAGEWMLIAESRLEELRALTSSDFDFRKLIRLCEELNIASREECYFATAMLTRGLLDHVPPIFSKKSFDEVASNYRGKSFKGTMQHLQNASRNVADGHLHQQIHKSVPFSERSAGFIWFFSFLVKFAQVQKDGAPLILLLDEPGLTLHGKAQGDLLRYFEEKLAPKHQVIFTTHSPFMVPPDNLPSVRLVEDQVILAKGRRVPNGTKVRADALATDRDTLFPLQGALGYELTQTLFIGKHTLLVEGPGDILYLQGWSSALKKKGQHGLDPRWTICPAGGIDKIQPFVSLFSGAKLDIAALTDYSRADKRKFDSLRQNKILESSRLLTFASILGVEEADVEDVMSPTVYATILNKAFELPADHKLTAEKLLDADTTTTRLVKKAEVFFRTLPPEIPEFDHFTPAAWMFQNLKLLEKNDADIVETLARAEKIIETLNALLQKREAESA